jgi:hypothetical protein
MAELSWKALAHELGDRMANHAFCNDHNPPLAESEGCPYCDDIAAYLLYAAKAKVPVDEPVIRETVSVADVLSGKAPSRRISDLKG